LALKKKEQDLIKEKEKIKAQTLVDMKKVAEEKQKFKIAEKKSV